MKKRFTTQSARWLATGFLTLLSLTGWSQTRPITGRVTGSNGAAITGANVLVRGQSALGTSTNADGRYTLDVPAGGAVLVFSYVGMEAQEVPVGTRTTVDVTLRETTSTLDDVFVTATSQPVRKIETVTAVESIGPRELARNSPLSLPDAIRQVPGVYVQTQAGRMRNYIFMRGFPDVVGNGLGYTSLLIDGLRTFASPEMVPDAAFRYDLNIERIEVVRGSAATLYGRGAAAGAVNVISKTGGTSLAGTLRLTAATNNLRQVDGNLNGPLNRSKTIRYNLGGFYLKDDGFRNNLFPDQGGQLRGNVDFLFPRDKGSLRISGGVVDLKVQNQLDIPYLATDFSKPAPGWDTRDVLMPRSVFENTDGSGVKSSLTYPDGTVEEIDTREATKKGNFSKGGNVGLAFTYKWGNGWSLSNRGRYQHITVGIGFDFGLTTTFGPNAAGVVFQQRANFGGGKTGGGSNATDFIDELRLNKSATLGSSRHNFTLGYYFSTINVRVASRGLLYGVDTRSKAEARQLPYLAVANLNTIPSLFRNGDYTEAVNSVFVGDEIKFGEKLSLNLGGRYDWIKLDLSEDRYAYQRNATRQPRHQDFSASLGLNYLFTPTTAVYANVVRAYRAPDYGAYTTVQYAYINADDPNKTPTLLNPGAATYPKDPAKVITTDAQGRTLYLAPYIDNNEIIVSVEGGFRKSFGNLSFDGGVFYNTITNRLVSTFIGALAVSVPGGNNKILGTELSLIFTPKSLRGFFARTSLTLQNAEYTKLIQEFTYAGDLKTTAYLSRTQLNPGAAVANYAYKVDVAGKKTANVPRSIWNLSLGYDSRRFGANVNNNYLGARPTDPHNVVDYPAYSLMDANVYVNFPLGKNNLRLKGNVYNLLDSKTAGNVISAVTDNYLLLARENNYGGNFAQVRGVPIIPRRFTISAEFSF